MSECSEDSITPATSGEGFTGPGIAEEVFIMMTMMMMMMMTMLMMTIMMIMMAKMMMTMPKKNYAGGRDAE